jgi:hypothetical protein
MSAFEYTCLQCGKPGMKTHEGWPDFCSQECSDAFISGAPPTPNPVSTSLAQKGEEERALYEAFKAHYLSRTGMSAVDSCGAFMGFDVMDSWEDFTAGVQAARTTPDHRDERIAVLTEALEGCAWQFGHRTTIDGKPVLTAAGLSDLEIAFSVLGWDDPHPLPEADVASQTCDIAGCDRWISGSWHWDGVYVRLCSEHMTEERQGVARRQLKPHAAAREASRDPVTKTLPFPALSNSLPTEEDKNV